MTPEPPFASRVVLAVSMEGEDFQIAVDGAIAERDDRYWAYYARQRFTWQHFIDWWAARRWVQPRDVRKR